MLLYLLQFFFGQPVGFEQDIVEVPILPISQKYLPILSVSKFFRGTGTELPLSSWRTAPPCQWPLV